MTTVYIFYWSSRLVQQRENASKISGWVWGSWNRAANGVNVTTSLVHKEERYWLIRGHDFELCEVM